jgi:uncharacterized protein (DUF58 family)
MIPSTRLLWLAAAMFPLAAAAGLLPATRGAVIVAASMAVTAAAVDAVFSRSLLGGVRAAPDGPLRLHRGRPGEVRLLCERGSAPVSSVRVGVAWPAGMEAERDHQTVRLQETGTVTRWAVTPRRRGEFTLTHSYWSCASRLGLWEIRRAAPLDAVIHVYPNMQGRDELLAIRRQSAGEHARRQLGRGKEFEHLREYVAGDGLDEIDWKATARRGKPITRVFQVERTQEIYAAVDASRLTGRIAGAEVRLERYIQAALALGAAAQLQGDRFGLVTFSDRMLDFVRAGKGSAQSALCRQALYRLQPSEACVDFQDVAAQLRVQLRARALILFLTDLDEPSAAESFRDAARLLSKKHLVAAVTLRPAEAEPLFSREADSFEDICRQIGGHLKWKGLKESESALRQAGAHFRLAEEPTLSRQVTGLYDDIKQRQLL